MDESTLTSGRVEEGMGIELQFMVVPELLSKLAYVPDPVRCKIVDAEAIFLTGILGESGRKLVQAGVEFYFARPLAEKLISKGIAVKSETPAKDILLVEGSKFKIVITLDAELVTDIKGGVSKEQIRDIMFKDPAYGLKSIVVGTVDPESEDDHDTEILWDTRTIEIL